MEEAKRLNNIKEYYFSKKLEEIRVMNASGKVVINLGIGSPDLPPDDSVIKELNTSSRLENAHQYQSYKGIPELRKAIADWQQITFGIHNNPENEILPLIGSKEGIFHISMAFVNPGDTVLIPNPGYPTYQAVSELVGANVKEYVLKEENNWQIDISELKKIDLDYVKLVWINTPHMPTGKALGSDCITQLILLAKKHDFLIINDNPYSLILNDKPTSIFNYDRAKEVCLELNSLSKIFNMAGWRVGWVCGNATLISSILKFKSNIDSGTFYPIQKAACEALQLGSEWYKQQNLIYSERRKKAYAILDYLNCSYSNDQQGMFVWAKVLNSKLTTEQFVNQILKKARVFITPGFIFGSQGDGFIRISLCSKSEQLEEALELIKSTSL